MSAGKEIVIRRGNLIRERRIAEQQAGAVGMPAARQAVPASAPDQIVSLSRWMIGFMAVIVVCFIGGLVMVSGISSKIGDLATATVSLADRVTALEHRAAEPVPAAEPDAVGTLIGAAMAHPYAPTVLLIGGCALFIRLLAR